MFKKIQILLFFVFFSACIQERVHHQDTEKITLAVYAGDSSALVYVAQAQGFFLSQGLDVRLQEYEAGKLAADAVYRGEADIATCADAVVVSGSFEREDIRVIGTVSSHHTVEFLARKSAGIQNVQDVKGKRVGVTRKSSGEFYLDLFLTFEGLSIKDVELVDLEPLEIVEALPAGRIDAASTWNPNAYRLKQILGQDLLAWPGQSGQATFFVLMTTVDFIQDNPSRTEKFMKALVEAERYTKNNDTQMREFVGKRFHYESAYVEETWRQHKFEVQLRQEMILVFEDQARWRIESGLTEHTELPNFLNFIYSDALEKTAPSSVCIIQ